MDGPPLVNQVVLVLWWLVLTAYYTLEAMVMMVVPKKYRAKDVRGSVVLVTGGGSGIGRLMCLKLAAKGAVVVTWDVSEAGNGETVRQVQAAGGQCRAYTVDLCDRQAVYAAATRLKQEVGKLDVLVNNAGVVTGKSLLHSPDTSIVKTFEVNALSHFWTTKAFLPDMVTRNKGHIVTIASILGKTPLNGLVDYCSSKYAAVGFDEALRMELKALGKTGIKTTLVCPSLISTGMFEGFAAEKAEAIEPAYVAEEVVEAVELGVGLLYLPKMVRLYVVLKSVLPEKAFYKMLELQGATRAMDTFVGRRKTH
ncbi:short-chain dehydrogenase/reductase family 16C member 6-like isoform X1 [Portunus trituberculatus]|uniref:short-chain dehydrogenase/reductase family 16C member 6-like isoform X1 n=1 Tax=Portunus trituberculatus TaxID=210409 RepID=UPI001E1CE214|nr:short-chain dehydrogenase/reductase family 16C member 6-like isoform X1 [Portunus trituberculatus]